MDDETSAVFYFNDIASCNDSLEHSVRVGPTDSSELMRHLLASGPAAPVDVDVGSPSCWVLQGRQHVAKFKEAEHNIVEVHVAVLRLPNVDSDVVVHYNQPLAIHADSSSTTLAQAMPAGSPEEGAELFEVLLHSLEGAAPSCPHRNPSDHVVPSRAHPPALHHAGSGRPHVGSCVGARRRLPASAVRLPHCCGSHFIAHFRSRPELGRIPQIPFNPTHHAAEESPIKYPAPPKVLQRVFF